VTGEPFDVDVHGTPDGGGDGVADRCSSGQWKTTVRSFSRKAHSFATPPRLTPLTSAGKAVTDRLGCELLLLTGRPEPAIAALSSAEPLGWHRASHPGPVVLPFLWAAAMGRPPDADDGHLGEMFTAIDRNPDALPRFEDWHTTPPRTSPGRRSTGTRHPFLPDRPARRRAPPSR
jgi:hypothetical protein